MIGHEVCHKLLYDGLAMSAVWRRWNFEDIALLRGALCASFEYASSLSRLSGLFAAGFMDNHETIMITWMRLCLCFVKIAYALLNLNNLTQLNALEMCHFF